MSAAILALIVFLIIGWAMASFLSFGTLVVLSWVGVGLSTLLIYFMYLAKSIHAMFVLVVVAAIALVVGSFWLFYHLLKVYPGLDIY